MSSCGDAIGKNVDIVARKFQWGPTAATSHILEILGQYDRELLLEKLRDSFNDLGESGIPALAKPCQRLILYAHPTETLQTQLVAFKNIVMLITSYPGLRYCFLLCKGIKGATDTNTAAMNMWKRPGACSHPEWDLFSQLAAACISAGEVAEIMEKGSIARMGVVSGEGGVIDDLLRLLACYSIYEVTGIIIIRYLGGILESPTFWLEENYVCHQYFAGKIFQKARWLLEDIGLGSSEPLGLITEKVLDTEGIDVLAQAAVVGVNVWRSQIPMQNLESQCWADDFMDLIKVLLRSDAREVVPKAGKQALEFAEYPCAPNNGPDHSDVEEPGINGDNSQSTKHAQKSRWGFWRIPVPANTTIPVAEPPIHVEMAASNDKPSIAGDAVGSDQEPENNEQTEDVTADSISEDGAHQKDSDIGGNHSQARERLMFSPASSLIVDSLGNMQQNQNTSQHLQSQQNVASLSDTAAGFSQVPAGNICFSRKTDVYGGFRLDSNHPVSWGGVDGATALHWFESGRFENIGTGLGAQGMRSGWTFPSTMDLRGGGGGKTSRFFKILGKGGDEGLRKPKLEYVRARTNESEHIMRLRTTREIQIASTNNQLEGFERRDWQQMWRTKLEEILYLKFQQHPDLLNLLVQTGITQIIFNHEDSVLGDGGNINGASSDGWNELGKALMRVRYTMTEQLLQEQKE